MVARVLTAIQKAAEVVLLSRDGPGIAGLSGSRSIARSTSTPTDGLSGSGLGRFAMLTSGDRPRALFSSLIEASAR